jgi:regulator of replication initiation timing
MKKYLTGAIVGILVTMLGGHFYTRWKMADLKKDNAILKEEIGATKTALAQLTLESDKRIEALLEQIGGLQGNIDSLVFANANLEEELQAQRESREAAEARAASLQAEIQPVLDANPKVREAFEAKDRVIAGLKAENFTLVQQRKNDQEIIFNLTQKYEAQVHISLEYQAQLFETRGLLQKVELRLNQQDRRVALLQRQGAWKTYGIVGVGILTLAAILL